MADQVDPNQEQSAELLRLVELTHKETLELLFKMSEEAGTYAAAGPIISGTIAALAEFLWRTRRPGTSAREALQFWTEMAREYFEEMEEQDQETTRQ